MVSSCVYYIVFPVLLSIFPTKIPGDAGDFLRSVFFLPFHVDQGLEHFVGDGDDLRVALETALGDNHIRELVRHVYVGHLKGRRRDGRAEGRHRIDFRLAGVVRLLIEAFADFIQAARIVEPRQGDLGFRLLLLHLSM